MLKKEDNIVPSFQKQVIYCASRWQGVPTEKLLKHVWFSCCKQNLSVSNFHTYTSHFINLDRAPWQKAPSNKLVKSEIELWFCGIRQSSAIVSRRVKPDLSECRFGQRDGSRYGQKGRRAKGSYTHKLCYPSERHDDVLPLVLGFHWQRARRDFQHPLQHQLQFRCISRQQGAFPFKLLPFWNPYKALCRCLTLQSVHSFTCCLILLFPQSSPLIPFHQTKWLSIPHSIECLLSKETIVYWSVVFITTSCIMQTPFLERGSIMYQVNSVSGSTRHSLRSHSRWMRFGKRNSWVL